MPRAAAKRLVRRTGGIVEDRVSHRTDVVVIGERSPHWKAEQKGQKLLDVEYERELGHSIASPGKCVGAYALLTNAMQGDAEIAQLQHTARGDEYVAGCDVAMNRAGGMQQRNGAKEADDFAARFALGPGLRMMLQIVEQIAAFHVFRDQAVDRLARVSARHPREGFVHPNDSRFIPEQFTEVGFAVPCPGLAGHFEHTLGRQWFTAVHVGCGVNGAEPADAKQVAHAIPPLTDCTPHQKPEGQAQSRIARRTRHTYCFGGERLCTFETRLAAGPRMQTPLMRCGALLRSQGR